MQQDYTQAQLMQDVMNTVMDNAPAIVQVAIFLASVNFVFNLLFWSLDFLARKPFKD